MNAASPNTDQLTHQIAAEINRMLAQRGMTNAELAAKIVESESFIRRVLAGEDGLGDSLKIVFLQKVVDATGLTMRLKISPDSRAKRRSAVEAGS